MQLFIAIHLTRFTAFATFMDFYIVMTLRNHDDTTAEAIATGDCFDMDDVDWLFIEIGTLEE